MISENEQLLVAGCKRGESWARRELYEKYAPAMLSVCVRYVEDRESAKDVLQDGFIKIFTHIRQFDARGKLGGWIRQIIVNTALEYLQKNEMLKMNVRMDEFSETLDEFDHRVLENVSADDLIECIAELPCRCRTVFNLHAIEGFSHAEIAQKLGIQENSSRSNFARARKSLQQMVLDLMKKSNVR